MISGARRRVLPGIKKASRLTYQKVLENSLLAFESMCCFISNYWRRQEIDPFLNVHMFLSEEISG
jgi:hypothetical protein